MFFNCKIKEIQGRDKGRQYENKGIYNNICFAMNESGEKWNMKQTLPSHCYFCEADFFVFTLSFYGKHQWNSLNTSIKK